jgi:hypothetical protein
LLADDHQRSIGCQQLNMISQVLGAHIVQDHVYAVTSDLANGCRPVVAVGDRVICSDRAAVVRACPRCLRW